MARAARPAPRRQQAAAYATERRLGSAERDAVERMVATVPQTLPGAAALLAYVRGHFEEGYPMCDDDGTMALLGSVECVVCRAAGLPVPSERRVG